MPNNILFHVDYMGHHYAQEALIEYLTGRYDSSIGLIKTGKRMIPDHLAQGFMPDKVCYSEDALHVTMLNNVNEYYRQPTLQVDEFLLKTCARQYSEADKDAIRAEYGLSRQRPIVGIGWANSAMMQEYELLDYFQRMSGYADLLFVGYLTKEWLYAHGIQGAMAENRRGYQKQAMAVSDATIYLEAAVDPDHNGPMHDVIEGTANSRHFHTKTHYTVYGSKKLEDAKALMVYRRIYDTFDALEEYVKNIAETPDPELPGILDERQAHIEYTRQTFLPIIKAHIDEMLGLSDEIVLHPDLVISEGIVDGGYVRMIRHRETVYGGRDCQDLGFRDKGHVMGRKSFWFF